MKKMPRLAAWDQEDYDKATHQIRQPRRLQLELSFVTGASPLAGQPVRVYTARSVLGESMEDYLDYRLDASGKLATELEYNESLIDAELTGKALPSGCGLDKMTLHWFHPGKWFEKLTMTTDIKPWLLTKAKPGDGALEFDLSYDPKLKPLSGYIGFGGLLGHTFDSGDGSWPECEIKGTDPGKAHIIVKMREFFKGWMKNYPKPFEAGQDYPIDFLFTFAASFGANPSGQKDPDFVPKHYDGRVDHKDGDPYLGVPSLDPESTIQIAAKRKIKITPDMLTG